MDPTSADTQRGALLRLGTLDSLRTSGTPQLAGAPAAGAPPGAMYREGPLTLCLVGAADAPAHVRTVRFGEGGAPWPATTAVLCWHCCHAFDAPPVPMPLRVRYAGKRPLEFAVVGNFCSVACMLAAHRQRKQHLLPVGMSADTNALLSFVHCLYPYRLREMHAAVRAGAPVPRLHRVAPPREMLAAFGGMMTIDEFRAEGGGEVQAVPPRLTLHRLVMYQYSTSTDPRPRKSAAKRRAETSRTVNLGPPGTDDAPNLKLRRAQPMSNMHGLTRRHDVASSR